jgi:hypothetical protein
MLRVEKALLRCLWMPRQLNWWIGSVFALGSLLYLASGWLACLETCHGHGFWQPGSLSWWVTVINLLGCIGFLGAALTGLVMPGGAGPMFPTVSLLFTLLGALGFLIGSLLMLPEAVVPS